MRTAVILRFKLIVRFAIGKLGGVVLSSEGHRRILSARDRAILELSVIDELSLRPGLTGVIFSRDRALQLHSLLTSYFELVINPASLKIIYMTSNQEHSDSYEQVKDHFLASDIEVEFIEEAKGGFKTTLEKVLDFVATKNIFFLVDDIVFINEVDLTYASTVNPRDAILSLRHSPYLSYSYTKNQAQVPPVFRENIEFPAGLEFNWFEQGCEWSYPWSVDGHVLSTAEVRVIAKVSDFKAPNSFETALNLFNSLCENRKGLCYRESKILNLPINRVQSEYKNISGDVSPNDLLIEWKNGMMLRTDAFKNHIPKSTHEEHTVTFKAR